jgi:hypothetical protein
VNHLFRNGAVCLGVSVEYVDELNAPLVAEESSGE